MRVLTVTAVAAERDAVVRAAHACAPEVVTLPGGCELHRVRWPETVVPDTTVDVLAAGVGPAAAAAGTATALTAAALAGESYGLVVSAGVAGGFPDHGPPPGGVAVATAIVAADLGAQTPAGFVPVTELGFGTVEHHPPPGLPRAVATATGGTAGPVLTVSTVTGTAEHAAALAARWPGAVAEAMEGFGAAEAAAAHGVGVLEVRTVSNAVGPRDRAAWRLPEAFRALTGAFEKMVPVLAEPDTDPEADPDDDAHRRAWSDHG